MKTADFSVDTTSALPVYVQLREQVLRAVGRGALHPGDQLPTIREIAVHLRVNPNTVNRAYIELEREGVLSTARGRGTFLAHKPRASDSRLQKGRLRDIARRALGEARAIGFSGAALLRVLDTIVDKKVGE